MWLVSTRATPHCCDFAGAEGTIRYWRLNEQCQWAPADAAACRAEDDRNLPTVIFIHGNRTNVDEAVDKGSHVRRLLCEAAAGKPFRYVIWSWPSDRVGRCNRPDIRLKAAYSDVESYYLAHWLGKLKPDVPVCLIGHSFGPRIITGALHLLAGGELAGSRLPKCAESDAAPRDRCASSCSAPRSITIGSRPASATARHCRWSNGCWSHRIAATRCCGGMRRSTDGTVRRRWAMLGR